LEKLDTDLKNYKSNSIKVIFHSYQQKLRFKFVIKASSTLNLKNYKSDSIKVTLNKAIPL
jgi:hypothetical protein